MGVWTRLALVFVSGVATALLVMLGFGLAAIAKITDDFCGPWYPIIGGVWPLLAGCAYTCGYALRN